MKPEFRSTDRNEWEIQLLLLTPASASAIPDLSFGMGFLGDPSAFESCATSLGNHELVNQ